MKKFKAEWLIDLIDFTELLMDVAVLIFLITHQESLLLAILLICAPGVLSQVARLFSKEPIYMRLRIWTESRPIEKSDK